MEPRNQAWANSHQRAYQTACFPSRLAADLRSVALGFGERERRLSIPSMACLVPWFLRAAVERAVDRHTISVDCGFGM